MSRKILALAAAAAVLVPVLIVGLGAQVKDAPPAEHLQSAADPVGGSAKPETAKIAPPKKLAVARDRTPLRGGEKAILKAMDEPATFEFVEAPLPDVVEWLQSKYSIPVVIDRKALADVGVEVNAHVNCSLSGIPLRSALELALHELQLTWTIKSDVLLITTPEVADQHLVVKAHDVTDLIVPLVDYRYRSDLPTTELDRCLNWWIAGFGMGGMGGVGAGTGTASSGAGSGGTGGGMFSVLNTTPFICGCSVVKRRADAYGAPDGTTYRAYDFDSLIDLITSTVRPSTWDACGGPGSIQRFRCMIVFAQTREVHREVELLLADLRAKQLASPTLLVELQWLWLDAKQHEQLVGGGKQATDGKHSLAVDAKALEELARTVPGFRGQIACSNAQAVHLASGDRRSVISSTIPVMDRSVGYQPMIQVPNVGIVVELSPIVAPGATTALLHVQSTVTRWAKPQPPLVHVGASWPPHLATEGGVVAPPPAPADQPGQPGKPAPTRYMAPQEITKEPGGSASSPIERPQMPAQQLATTLRVPLGKPVIVGAMTFAPEGDAGLDKAADNPRQLYVIATTSVVSEP
jgi:hypothetical protein